MLFSLSIIFLWMLMGCISGIIFYHINPLLKLRTYGPTIGTFILWGLAGLVMTYLAVVSGLFSFYERYMHDFFNKRVW